MSIDEIDTPALLVDLDVIERNVLRMRDMVAPSGIRLRPHSKTHKSVDIAHLQLHHGAVGVCCQKMSEAEIMVQGGVTDVLIANEVVGRTKVARVAALARHASVAVCVDDAANIAELMDAAQARGTIVHVLVELNVGANRCGVSSPEEVVGLAREIVAAPALRFGGIHAYQGAAQHLRGYAARQDAIARAVGLAAAARDALHAAGIPCPCITGAGTGSFEFELASGVYTELQAGSYVFMDRDYGLNRGADGGAVGRFDQALFVLSTVVSRVRPDCIVFDAGLKAYSTDAGLPAIDQHPELVLNRASDEHGCLDIGAERLVCRPGDKIRLIPGHCDPTVNLHDWMVCVRDDRVEAIWPVSARGAVF